MNRFKLPHLSLWFAMVVGLVHPAGALTNGLALAPPMGWNSWNAFHCGINEALIRQIADAMATNGMKVAGYQYVNIDDCWQIGRETNGMIVVDTNAFPGGIHALAGYIHAKGLKFGIYSARGPFTCGGRPGSRGYEALDAQTYASWGVDYLKYDNCYAGGVLQADYLLMRDSLAATGRPIVFSICTGYFGTWMPDYGNLWRTTFDISDSFTSMVSNLDQNNSTAYYAGPGRWNDPDMLEVGNGGMTETEYQAHFSLWCVVAAPLLAGNDLRNMTPATLAILTNPEAIAVNQDPAGVQGVRVASSPGAGGNLEVWCKPLGSNAIAKAVVLFNRGTNAANITANWSDLLLQNGGATVRDLWARADLGTFTNSFTANVPLHGVKFLKLVSFAYGPTNSPPLVGTNYLSDLSWLSATNGWGPVEKDMSNGEQAPGDGLPLTLNGVTYTKGLGVHANSSVTYYLGGVSARFFADVGLDDETCGLGSVIFQVYADGTILYASGFMESNSTTRTIDLDVSGHDQLTLVVTDGGDNITCDHADWAGARLMVTPPPFPHLGVALVGNQLIVNGGGGSNGAPYRLLASTNLSLPANQWAVVSTNQFDTNGNFLFTNAIDPAAPQLFFRLSQL